LDKNLQETPQVITIDGPTGSGKGTIGQLLAEKLHWHFLDSGALYRVLALAALQQHIQSSEHDKLISLAHNLDIELIEKPEKLSLILYQGNDVTLAIRQEGCGIFASQIAVIPEIREALREIFHKLRKLPGLVADGRDMGTIVFPDAILKIFLTASPELRSQRRQQQLQEKGINVSLREIELDLSERDMRDAKRIVAPLKPALDAFIIDSTNLNIDGVLNKIFERLKQLGIASV
jgi:cytidylate kinase